MGRHEATKTTATATASSIHIMMFPFLAFGHINPFLQLARKISTVDPSARITILSAPTNVVRITSLLPQSSSTNIAIHPIHLPKIPGLPEGAESTAALISPAEAELLKLAVDGTKPQLQSILTQLKPDCVLFDFAQPWLPSVAAPLGIKTLFFSTFAAISTAYFTVPSRRNAGPTPAIDGIKNPPAGFPTTSSLSGGVPTYQARDFGYIFKKFNDRPSVYDSVATCLRGCNAIVAKTCMEMEEQYISYVESEYKKPILLAGPVVPEPPSGELDTKWADWLGRFDRGSVVFCSLGSETLNLNDESVRELLLGLELAGMPFLVVLNFLGGEGEMKKKLPSGFEERVKGRGVVHCGWVQQQLILRHSSIGCFVGHVGFSSVVEGLVAGCKLVFLPQRGDQYVNAALFARDLGVGVEVERDDESGGFGREAVRESVKKVMADVEMGERHRKWRGFLLDKKVEEGFMEEFVRKLKAIITDNGCK